MNNRIFYIASISVILQLVKLLLVFQKIESLWLTEVIFIFFIIAIPFAFIQLFRDKKQGEKVNTRNIIGIFLALPSIIIVMLLCKSFFYKIPEIEIDRSSIKIYDKENKKIPIDSLRFIIEKDSNKINTIKLR